MPPTPRPTFPNLIQNLQFLSVWVDEGHLYRNNITPLITIARSCTMLVTLTATPLFTGHRDLLSIGHILNFKGLCSPVAMEKHKSFSSHIEKAHTAHHATLIDGEQGSEESVSEELKDLINAQLEPVSWLKSFFKGRTIRRTGDSKDFEGKPIIGLCAHRRLVVTIKLSNTEMELLEAAHKDCREEGRSVTSFAMSTYMVLTLSA
jgi:hypothetical protein